MGSLQQGERGQMKTPLDHRAALGALASITTLAVPAAANSAPATLDPIFAAIERHRVACSAFVAGRSRGMEL